MGNFMSIVRLSTTVYNDGLQARANKPREPRFTKVSHVKLGLTRRAFMKAAAMSWVFVATWPSSQPLRAQVDDASYGGGVYGEGVYAEEISEDPYRLYLPSGKNEEK
jgi:hypothetical protein